MVERKPSLGRTLRILLAPLLYQGARAFAETPFAIRAIKAPRGEIVRGEKHGPQGKIVRDSGKTYVILTQEGVMVFPNPQAGDRIVPLPRTRKG